MSLQAATVAFKGSSRSSVSLVTFKLKSRASAGINCQKPRAPAFEDRFANPLSIMGRYLKSSGIPFFRRQDSIYGKYFKACCLSAIMFTFGIWLRITFISFSATKSSVIGIGSPQNKISLAPVSIEQLTEMIINKIFMLRKKLE